ncbi:hypothetical protein MSG28_005291 [Choristoneura fumiferana]|uniref:Uncharacterized protein n=1 Tax=Choristoneura fumiferana TaxID=7141 RepID=A0ACC0JQS9_CHOFU|nr:hypothetical protein MSG28_005291 [Choristoneura fumiferana]
MAFVEPIRGAARRRRSVEVSLPRALAENAFAFRTERRRTVAYPDWASYNLGIFICMRCASIHRGMGAHISQVKHLKLDRWEDSQVQRMRDIGNIVAKNKYEERVPPCYRRPTKNDPQVLIEQWIRAKYQREEFTHNDRQNYLSGSMEGFLMKRGKEDNRYQLRKFILNESEDTLKYHVKENKEPKGILKLSELNVAFAPSKIGQMNSMQLTFIKDGSTRHIYVYHDDPEIINTWYMAIRCAKLHLLQVAFPSAPQSDLILRLPKDFAREGHESNGYYIKVSNTGNGCKEARFPFHLVTPDRIFCLAAISHEDRAGWLVVLQQAIKRPLSPQDSTKARFPFYLVTPDRSYCLTAVSAAVASRLYQLDLLHHSDLARGSHRLARGAVAGDKAAAVPQDSTIEATLVRKRTTSNSMSIFSGR